MASVRRRRRLIKMLGISHTASLPRLKGAVPTITHVLDVICYPSCRAIHTGFTPSAGIRPDPRVSPAVRARTQPLSRQRSEAQSRHIASADRIPKLPKAG